MPAIQRTGDPNTAGGTVTSSQNKVRANGMAVSVDGSSVSTHPPCPNPPSHCSATTANGNTRVRAGGIPINSTNGSDTCGHSRSGGSPNVRVG